MKQLKVSTTWLNRTKRLSDAERGRLFTAMLQYASDGTAPDLSGREAGWWDEAQEQIDEQRSSYERQQAGNTKRHDEASCGMTGHDEASRGITPHDEGIEKASPQSSPTPLSITPLKERKKTSPKGESKERSLSPALQDALRAFKDMRNRMHKPMTQLAVDLLVQKLEKLASGDTDKQVAILMQSIENGWTGVYELKERNDRKRNTLLNYQESGKSHPNLGDIEMDLDEL